MGSLDLVVQGPTAVWGHRTFSVVTGRSGVRREKREGDGATPAGVFPFRSVFYRRDRLGWVLEDARTQHAQPAALGSCEDLPAATLSSSASLPVRATRPDDGWCDDSAHPLYNRHVQIPFDGRHELLWRDDSLYDVVLVVGHNDQPVVPGEGSAIFIHVMHPLGRPTEGCVGMKLEDLLCVLEEAQPGSCLVVKPS